MNKGCQVKEISSKWSKDSSMAKTHLEQPVFLAQVDRLLPAVVAFVQVGADSSKFDQFVFFKSLCQGDVVEIVEGVDRSAKTLVVFFFDEEIVEGLVDRFVVVVLEMQKKSCSGSDVIQCVKTSSGRCNNKELQPNMAKRWQWQRNIE